MRHLRPQNSGFAVEAADGSPPMRWMGNFGWCRPDNAWRTPARWQDDDRPQQYGPVVSDDPPAPPGSLLLGSNGVCSPAGHQRAEAGQQDNWYQHERAHRQDGGRHGGKKHEGHCRNQQPEQRQCRALSGRGRARSRITFIPHGIMDVIQSFILIWLFMPSHCARHRILEWLCQAWRQLRPYEDRLTCGDIGDVRHVMPAAHPGCVCRGCWRSSFPISAP